MKIPLFISFGPEIVFYMILFGLLWLLLILVQLGLVAFAVRAILRKQVLRATLWGAAAFALIAGVPTLHWIERTRTEAEMASVNIIRGLPDLTGKTVLYVPSRSLDDTSLSCVDLVRLSGAETVYLAAPWSGWRSEVAPDVTQPIDLSGLIRGIAVIEPLDVGVVSDQVIETCVLKPAPPPDRLDYILIRNHVAEVEPAFAEHLVQNMRPDPRLRLQFALSPVEDMTAFELSAERVDLALFRTWRAPVRFPYTPWPGSLPEDIPRDWVAFQAPLRQVVCREPVDAPEQTCWPFQ